MVGEGLRGVAPPPGTPKPHPGTPTSRLARPPQERRAHGHKGEHPPIRKLTFPGKSPPPYTTRHHGTATIPSDSRKASVPA